MARKSRSWMKTSVSPPLAARTASTRRASPGTNRSSPMRRRGPLGTSRMPVASTTRTPGRPAAKRAYQSRSAAVTSPSAVARQGTIAGTQVRVRAPCARPSGRGEKRRARAASAAVGQPGSGSAWRITSEIESDAQRAFDAELEARHEVQRGRQLEEHLEHRRVGEHQIQADGHARGEREAVTATASVPDGATPRADVPVELGLPAHDVRLPEVVGVERARVIAEAIAGPAAVRAAVEPIAPEPQAEVDRVRRADPELGREARRVAHHEAEAELAPVTDLGGVRRARRAEQEEGRHTGGDEGRCDGGDKGASHRRV